MHTVLEACPEAHGVSYEGACPTVPSPHVGEGQGEGWRRNTEREVRPVHKRENDGCLHLLDRRYETEAVRVVPLSLSLPHRGGENAVALLCLTASSIRPHAREDQFRSNETSLFRRQYLDPLALADVDLVMLAAPGDRHL